MAKGASKKAVKSKGSPIKVAPKRLLHDGEAQALRSAMTLRNTEGEKFYVLLNVMNGKAGEPVEVDQKRGSGKWIGNLLDCHSTDERYWIAELKCLVPAIRHTGGGDIIDVDITVTSSGNPPPVNEPAVIFP